MRKRLSFLTLAAFAVVSAAPPAAADKCKCRAPGKQVELGETACIATPKGFRIARCGLVLNNTAWHVTDTPCIVSQGDPAATLEFVAREVTARGGG